MRGGSSAGGRRASAVPGGRWVLRGGTRYGTSVWERLGVGLLLLLPSRSLRSHLGALSDQVPPAECAVGTRDEGSAAAEVSLGVYFKVRGGCWWASGERAETVGQRGRGLHVAVI